MNGSVVSQPQDVYAERSPLAGVPALLPEAGVTVMLECTSAALARVYALLCTVDLVPAASCAALCGEDAIRLDLAFESVPGSRLEMLVRKLAQLTECLEVNHTLQLNTTGFSCWQVS